jgi:chromosome segregation ATPase
MSTAHTGEPRDAESALKGLWERVRLAAETIARLRQEKRELSARVAELSEEVESLKHMLAEKEEHIGRLSQERTLLDSRKSAVFANGEREVIAAKVKELLAKIDSYL